MTDTPRALAPRLPGRRAVMSGLAASFAFAPGRRAAAEPARRILFVHGRSQGRRDPATIEAEWGGAFARGAAAAGMPIPDGLHATLPFYGATLDAIVARFDLPLNSQVVTRGEEGPSDYVEFQKQVATELARRAEITDAEIDAELPPGVRERGPANWEWVQAILKALDRHAGGVTTAFLEVFLRDVYLYVTRSAVRREINGIVAGGLTGEPTVVVGHSLGSVVAYDLLGHSGGARVPLLMTIGSPLGIRAVRNPFRPIRSPAAVGSWINAYDPRDVVALVPLDRDNFDVTPPIRNVGDIRNQTDNRHGITGYLDKAAVAGPILAALG